MQPKVFISYCWSNPKHEDWVLSLAQRLVHNGVDVVIDKWNLKEGQDKFVFMESMVKAQDISKVLIILDRKYANKADERGGGVGTETQIISPKVYENVGQEKFIPIVAEISEDGEPYIPTYLKGRIYIDLSTEEEFEENYEKLLRNIANRPLTAKPKLGELPSYILEDTPMNFKTTAIVRGFENQIDRHPNRINSILRDFLNDFFDNLKDFRISAFPNNNNEAGKVIFEKLNQYLPLRDDYIIMMKKISKASIEWDADLLIRLFERLPSLFYPQESVGSWYTSQFDIFRFIIHELFMYTIAIFLKDENYSVLDHLLNTKYFIKDRYQSDVIAKSYDAMYHNVDILNYYYEQINSRRFIDVQADFMIKRLHEGITVNDFVNGDLLCYYIGLFSNVYWFPKTYIYNDQHEFSFEFFNRLISKRHFDKIKTILNVATVEELKSKIIEIARKNDKNVGYSNARSYIPKITDFVKVELAATSR